MREKVERFSLLPFSIGCVSHSSVDVISNNPKKASTESNTLPPIGEDYGDEKMKSSNVIGERLHKIVKGFKSLPQVFQLYRDEEEEEDDEVEMEIGLPTDVQHVAHIGWDGTNNITKSWNRTADQLLSFPSLPVRQIEIAMAKEGGSACMLRGAAGPVSRDGVRANLHCGVPGGRDDLRDRFLEHMMEMERDGVLRASPPGVCASYLVLEFLCSRWFHCQPVG